MVQQKNKQYGDNVSNRNEQFKNEYERKMRSCKVPSRIVLVFLLIYIAYFFVLPFSYPPHSYKNIVQLMYFVTRKKGNKLNVSKNIIAVLIHP